MTSDAHRALAFVARRGAATMPADQWAHVLSLELGWLTPADARRFVAAAEEAGLLRQTDGGVAPTFAWRDVEVPRRFRLSPDAVPEPATEPNDPFMVWLERVAAATETPKGGVLDRVHALQEEMGGYLDAEAAILALAAEAGLDVKAAAGEALARLGPQGS